MKFINELHEGEKLSGIYLCKHKQAAVTKNGKPYENVILQDKTGTIDAKIWDPNSLGIDEFDSLDYIDVVGDVNSFQGSLQVSIKRVRKASEGEYEPGNYLPVSSQNPEVMYKSLLSYVAGIKILICTGFWCLSLRRTRILQSAFREIQQQRVYIMVLSAVFWSIP